MANFDKYKKLKKSLDKTQKREFNDLIFFYRTAMICTMSKLEVEEFTYSESEGFAVVYELMMEICDKVLLSNKSEFIKYCNLYFSGDKRADEYFSHKHDTCSDWFFMNLAEKEMRKQLKDYQKV